MKANCFFGNHDVRVEEVAEPTIEQPTDALMRVTLGSICGSDLHYYHQGEELGFPPGWPTGHEALGTIEAVGAEVRRFRPGDRVLGNPLPVDGTCRFCRERIFPCAAGWGAFGYSPVFCLYGGEVQGCHSELLRVPLADGTLTPMPESVSGPEHESALLVIGDGGMGLCAVAAAVLKGAEQVFEPLTG